MTIIRSFNLHLAAALPNATMSCELTCSASQSDMAETTHQRVNGTLLVSDSPGCDVSSIVEKQRINPSLLGPEGVLL